MLFIAHLEGVDNSWLTSLTWKDFANDATKAQQWYCGIYWVITTVGASRGMLLRESGGDKTERRGHGGRLLPRESGGCRFERRG